MGYVWFVYFAAMALAFWFAMTLMYDGNEAWIASVCRVEE